MPRIPFAAAALAAILAFPTFAQGSSHRHGAYAGHHYRPHYSYRYYGGRSVFGWPRYYSYLYPAPLFGYAFAPPPRVYAVPYPEYEEELAPLPALPVQREYRERSYAQVDPSPRPMPSAPAPSFDHITLSATELFEFDKATLRAPQPRLDEIAQALVQNPDVGSVTITGYTDRLGGDAYNLKLSQRRADAVKAYLVRQGVAASRLKSVGRGKANPVVHCDDKDRNALIRCLEPNRRVEVERITIERAVAPKLR